MIRCHEQKVFDLTSFGRGTGSLVDPPLGPPRPCACHGYLLRPWVSVWILRGGEEETTTGFLEMRRHRRMKTVVGVGVFEAEALG